MNMNMKWSTDSNHSFLFLIIFSLAIAPKTGNRPPYPSTIIIRNLSQPQERNSRQRRSSQPRRSSERLWNFRNVIRDDVVESDPWMSG